MSAAQDLTGADEGPLEAPVSPPSRVARVTERVREVVRSATSAQDGGDPLNDAIEQGLRDLAAEERVQFTEAIEDRLNQFLEIVGAGHFRAALMGAAAASAVWILVFVFMLAVFLIIERH